MKISLIVAMSENQVIGSHGAMPWHISADLKKFKQLTLGSPVIMGRKTHESIGKPLPGRRNIIISRNQYYQQQDCQVFNDLYDALKSCEDSAEVFVIGGAKLYQSLLPRADYLYLTKIHKKFDGDTYFPHLDWLNWEEISVQEIDDDDSVDFSYSFHKLERIHFSDVYDFMDVGC